MAKEMQMYKNNGISVSKTSIVAGDELTLSYNGVLAERGADSIYAHIGYGDTWEDKDFVQMKRSGNTFKTSIKVKRTGSLNICFKDSTDNWDNNDYSNYTFRVAPKSAASREATKADTKKVEAKREAPKTTKTATVKSTKTSEPKKTTTAATKKPTTPAKRPTRS
jgi:hypothetical protein